MPVDEVRGFRVQEHGGADQLLDPAPAAGRDARGVLVHLGLGGEITLPFNSIVAKELELRGTFRFHEEFRWAVDLIASSRVDVTPLLTEVIPLERAAEAFELASDRRRAMKVQLAFNDGPGAPAVPSA